MNKNQKIALGCGGAGCLGLIVVVVAGVLIYMFTGSLSTNRNYNFNSNANRPLNRNSNTPPNENGNASPSSATSSSMSDDEKHRLFQAVGMTGDTTLITRVLKKIGMVSADGIPTADYAKFTKDHFSWALKNAAFIQSVSTKEKAQAYVDEHLDD